MKKLSFLLAFVLVVGLLFTACNTDKPTDPTKGDDTPQTTAPAAEEGYDGSAVTIKFYHTMGQKLQEVLNEYIPEFNKLYPNITVEHEQVGGYDDVRDQIKTEITVGNQPNLAYCYPDHVALYNKAGAVQTLDSLINSTAEVTRADGTTEIMGLTAEQVADYVENYYAEGSSYGDGQMYSIPFSKSTEVMYYNKTFFEENDLKVPTTWDEMYEVCKKIKEIVNDPEVYPLGYDSEANWFITLAEQYGSAYTSAEKPHYLFNNETNRNFVKELNKWYREDLATTQTLAGSYTSNLFKEKKCYICIGSSAGATYQRPDRVDGEFPFEVGITIPPQVNPENPKIISQGPSVCIFKKANMQEVYASWLFLKYLTTSSAFQADFAIVSGYVPVIKSVESDEQFADELEKADGGEYIAGLSMKTTWETKGAQFVSPPFVGSSTARTEVGSLLVKCLGFKGTDAEIEAQIEEAFEDAIEECEYQD